MRLLTRFSTLTITLILLSTLGVTLFLARSMVYSRNEDLRRRAATSAAVIAESAQYGVFTENEEVLLSLVDALKRDPSVAYAAVYSMDQRVLAQRVFHSFDELPLIRSDGPVTGGVEPRVLAQTKEGDGARYLDALAPVVTETAGVGEELLMDTVAHERGETIGYVRVGVSQVFLEREIEGFLRSTLTYTVVLLLLGILATVALTRRIVAPIQNLARASGDVSDGQLTSHVPVQGGLEVERLAHAFNRMVERLGVARGELLENQQRLEETVEERTRELRLSNERLRKEFAVRERAEQARRESEQRLKLIVQGAPVILFALDPNGVVTVAEGHVMKRLPFDPGRLVGANVFEAKRDMPQLCDAVRKALDGRDASVELEMEDVALEVRLSPRRNEAGEIEGCVGVATDVSERREVDRLKDELMSTVSHELRTPLTSLRGFAELMVTRDYGRDQQLKFLEIILQESERLTNLVNNFLDIRRIESGRQEFRFEPTNLASLVRESAAVYGGPGESHEWEFDLPEDLPLVPLDESLIRQVLSNLFSNALKFSPNGGTVTVGLVRDGSSVVLSVRDEGVGIPENAIPRLFHRFVRVDSDATKSIGGTGLGLALIRDVIDTHGGEVWVESEEGKGSTFYVRLPLSRGGKVGASVASRAVG